MQQFTIYYLYTIYSPKYLNFPILRMFLKEITWLFFRVRIAFAFDLYPFIFMYSHALG